MSEKQNLFGQRSASLPTTYTDPSAVAAAESVKARIQAAYIMALQKPRKESDARDAILRNCKRTEFAEKAEYSKPIGAIKVKGPSIRFAELSLREWGNILSEVQTLYEDENNKRIRVSVLDLETNAQFSRDIQLKKTIERRNKKGRDDDYISERKNTRGDIVYILRATDEEMYTKESAWVSRVLRNEGLRLIPTDIIEEGLMVARQTLAERVVKDPEGEKKKILDAFSSIGVRPKDIERYVNHSVDTLSPAEIVSLRTAYQSIRDGEATWNDYFGHGAKEGDSDPGLKGDPESKKNKELIDQFYSLIEKESKQKYEFKDGYSDSLTTFIKKTASGQTPSVKPIDFIPVIMRGGEKQFEAFWNAYLQFMEKLKSADTASGNPYDKIKWKSSKYGAKAIADFANKHDEEIFKQASPESRQAFNDKWHLRFTNDEGKLEKEFPFEWPIPKGASEEPPEDSGTEKTKPDGESGGEPEDYDRTDELTAVMEQNEDLYLAACEACGWSHMLIPEIVDEQNMLWDKIKELEPQFKY